MGEHQFDYNVLLDGLRCRPSEWLETRRDWLVREQRRLHVEELAVLRVLDERGRVDDTLAGKDGESVRNLRDKRETARAMEHLPAISQRAAHGDLSGEQLSALSKLADAGSDREWAHKGPSCSPEDLRHQARLQTTPTAAQGAARRRARELRFWWEKDAGMLAGRFRLPDVDGALFERVLNQMIDKMRPAKGQAWETRDRRGADALVALCRDYAHMEAPSGPTPYFSVQIRPDGPATVAGIPLPDEMVEALRAEARIQTTVIDGAGAPLVTGRTTSTVSAKDLRAVRLRDGKCRWPGCDRRTGLQVHHLWPRSWGGPDHRSNLACVCVGGGTDHHTQLAPHGDHLLLGNPNDPHGLHLIHLDDLPALAQHAEHQPRAGPTAA